MQISETQKKIINAMQDERPYHLGNYIPIHHKKHN